MARNRQYDSEQVNLAQKIALSSFKTEAAKYFSGTEPGTEVADDLSPDVDEISAVSEESAAAEDGPGPKEKKAKQILLDSYLEFSAEYHDKAHPVVLKIQRKYAKKYWDYYGEYLLGWGIGKEDDKGGLIPYKYDELGTLDNGDDHYLVIFAQGENLRKDAEGEGSGTQKEQVSKDEINPQAATPAAENDPQTASGDAVNEEIPAGGNWELVLELQSPDEVPAEPSRYGSPPRTDLRWDRKLTADQEIAYRWSEAYALIKSANPGQSTNTLTLWTRRVLADGWDIDLDPVPKIKEIYDKELDGKSRHIIEANTYDEAFAYANRKKKAGDYTYKTFVWRRKISHEDMVSGTSYAPANAYTNYKENIHSNILVNFDELAAFAGPEATGYLNQIKSIKAYSDKLLSPAFVNLVYKVQQKLWPETENAAKRTGIWNDATKTKYAAYPAEQKKKADDEAKRKADLEYHQYYVGDDDGNGYRKFVRDNRPLRVKMSKLKELQDMIITDYHGADEILEDYYPPNPQEKPDLAYMLTVHEREMILKAYDAEWDVDEVEEAVVTLILQNIPDKDLLAMRPIIKNYEDNHNLKDWIDYDKNISNYNTARETITGKVDLTAVNKTYNYVDVDDDAEDAAEDLNVMLPSLSPGQIKAFDWVNRKKFLDIFLQEDGPTDSEDWDYFSKLFVNVPPGHVNAVMIYLQEGDFARFVRLVERTPEPQKKEINDLLDVWYGNDKGWVAKLRQIGNVGSYSMNFQKDKHTLFCMPKAVYEQLNDNQRAKIYQYVVVRGEYSDEQNGAILIKVLETVSSGEIDKTKYSANRQAFFNRIDNDIDIGFSQLITIVEDDDERDHIHALLNDMDAQGRKDRIETTLDESRSGNSINYEADDYAARLGDGDMAALELKDRKIMINNLVGRGGWESFFTRVGDRDEKTLLRLIYTTPDTDMQGLMNWLSANSGTVYNRIQSAIDGENYQKLHDNFSTKKYQSIENQTDPEKKKNDLLMVRDMQDNGQTDPAALPWDDYSLLGLVFFSSGIEYDVEWTDEGKISISYETVDWKDAYLGSTFAQAGKFKEEGLEFGAWDWVAVYSKEEDKELGLAQGEVRVMPAINMFKFAHKQDMGHLWEAIDIITLVIGFGELKAATSFLKWLLAFTDVFVSAGNMMTRTFGDRLPESWVKNWQSLSSEIATFQFLYIGLTAAKALRNRIAASRKLLSELPLKPAERNAAETLLDTNESMLDEGEKIMQSTDKPYLQNTLDELEKSKSTMDPVAYDSLKHTLTERLALLDNEVNFQNSPGNKVPENTVPQKNIPEKVVPDVSKTPELPEKPVETLKYLVKKSGGETVIERVEITYGGKVMAFEREAGDAWKLKGEADEMSETLGDALNKEKGFDDVAQRVKNGTLGELLDPKKYEIVTNPAELADFVAANNVSSTVDLAFVIKMVKGRRDLCESILLSTKETIEGKTVLELVEHFRIPEIPSSNSMSNYQTRIWYKWQKSRIPELLDKNAPLEQQAKQAFDLRNDFRTRARQYMNDKELAAYLEANEPNFTFGDLVKRNKATKNLTDAQAYETIIETSSHGREAVDDLFKLNDTK